MGRGQNTIVARCASDATVFLVKTLTRVGNPKVVGPEMRWIGEKRFASGESKKAKSALRRETSRSNLASVNPPFERPARRFWHRADGSEAHRIVRFRPFRTSGWMPTATFYRHRPALRSAPPPRGLRQAPASWARAMRQLDRSSPPHRLRRSGPAPRSSISRRRRR